MPERGRGRRGLKKWKTGIIICAARGALGHRGGGGKGEGRRPVAGGKERE